MTLNDELQTGKQVEETKESTRTDLTFAHAHRQVADAKEAVTCGAPRVQDRLAKVWTALTAGQTRGYAQRQTMG